MMKAGIRTCLALSAALALTGCRVEPVERSAETNRFRAYLEEQQEQLTPEVAQTLSMADCERIALANSLGLQLQRMALSISDDTVRLALTGALPQLSAGYRDTTRSNDNLINQGGMTVRAGDRHEQSAGVQATVPILDWGITYYSWQIARDARKQDLLLLNRAQQTLVRDVRIAYTRHAGAVRREALLAQALQAAHEVQRIARSLERAGETVRAETALVEASVAQAEVDLAVTQKDVRETKLRLAQLMSLPPALEFSVDTTLPPLPEVPTAEQLAEMEDRALVARPELAVQDLQRQISAYEVKRAAAAFFPRIDGIGGFNWSSSSQLANSSWFFGGVQVSHGLLNGGADIFRHSIAKNAREIETARTLLLSLGVLYEVELRALTVRENFEVARAAASLEVARQAGMEQIISLYNAGLQDPAGAARALADLTIQSTALDRAQQAYLVAWHELEAAALPERSVFALPAVQDAPAEVQDSTEQESE